MGAGRCTRLSSVARASLMSWRLAPSTASPTGIPRASVNRLRLTPVLPRSVGLGGFSPRPGGTFMAPSMLFQDPSIRHNESHLPKPEGPRRRPIPESADGPSTGANARGVQRRCAARDTVGAGGLEPGAVLRPKGGYSPAWESVGPAPPTGRRIPERN